MTQEIARKEFLVRGTMHIREKSLDDVLIKIKRMKKAGFEFDNINIAEITIIPPYVGGGQLAGPAGGTAIGGGSTSEGCEKKEGA